MRAITNCTRRVIQPSRYSFSDVFIIAVIAMASLRPAAAQDASKPQEPEYVNSFFLLEPGGNLEPLERQPVGVGGKASLFSNKVQYEIQNEKSPVRIAAGAKTEIIVKLENHDVDPATVVLLYPLKVAKAKRQLLIMGAGFMALHTKSDLQSKQIQMVFTKYGQSSLRITSAAPLPPGEYAIAVQSQNQQLTAYCFGVDPEHP
jgi:hypothetical protein